MSTYFKKGKGWRYDFTLAGQRYTEAWFKTMHKAQAAEADKRKEINEPPTKESLETQTPTDTEFLELANRRLDHVKARNSQQHYQDYRSLVRRWVQRWKGLYCNQISQEMIEEFVLVRAKVSHYTANKEIRSLRATFNFGKKKKLLTFNPVEGIDFLPEDGKTRYLPPPEDLDKVMAAADQDAQDYLWTIRDTLARVSEINRLTWDDVNLKSEHVVLYTRKKKGSHLTPRTVPMTDRLYKILSRRYSERDPGKPWVFWHTYWSSKTGKKCEGPYGRRKRLMSGLCKKAGVRCFQFHALRHSAASLMESRNIPIGSIQRILGHSSRMTTEIYLHQIAQADRHAIKVLEQADSGDFLTHKSHTGGESSLTQSP